MIKPIKLITFKMAWRNLRRNSRRTFLSILGISIGCSISLLNISLQKGKIEIFIRNVAEGGIGHFRVTDQKWLDSRDRNLRLKNFDTELQSIRALPEVLVATPRARVQGLLAMGTHMQGTEVVGVDPQFEPKALRFARTVSKGRYLEPHDQHKIVVGEALAQSLNSDVGDSLVLTVVDKKGNLQSQMFEIVGLVKLGNDQLEKGFAQINLTDIGELTGLVGAGEITVLLKDFQQLDRVTDSIKQMLPMGDSVFSWKEISSQVNLAVRVNEASTRLLTFIFVFVAFLGVSSAQLTAVLERRREFAVLSALGAPGIQLIGFIITESLFLGTISLLSTLLLATPLAFLLEKFGIRVLSGSSQLSIMGTALEPVIHGQVSWWIVGDAMLLSYLSTLFSGIYPALFAARVDPADALRTAQ